VLKEVYKPFLDRGIYQIFGTISR